MEAKTVRQKYLQFFKILGHQVIAPAPLVLINDPTTLFTSAGMQPLVPYLLGQSHPLGKRLVDSQPSFRAEDIDEVGDNRHTTFFEMLGNWSLGDYFKKEQLGWFWEFLTVWLKLSPDKLYVSVFAGNESVPKDEETYNIWKALGVKESHIYFYGVDKNWWSLSGAPGVMKEGEIGGPDSEIFYDFATTHNLEYGQECHPNCDCGRFLEIGNSVFIQYQKQQGKLKELSQKNVDFGGGLERLTAACNHNPDIFQTDLYIPIIKMIETTTGKRYENFRVNMQVMSDHIKAATFMIINGVEPSNKLQGYILRRLLRRSAVKLRQIDQSIDLNLLARLVEPVEAIYRGQMDFDWDNQVKVAQGLIKQEMERFNKTLDRGLKEVEKMNVIDGKIAFNLYQTFGFPFEVTEELARLKGQEIDKEQFKAEFEKHRELSRTASAGMFKGGLIQGGEQVTKYHTATHLLHQALRDILGPKVFQKGSNITQDRLRFDFSFGQKMTDGEIKKVEDLVNEKIQKDLKVDQKIVSLEEARKMGAIGLFHEKYGSKVSVYGIGPGFKDDPASKDQRKRGHYSLEFCGGPHIKHTGLIGKIKIVKEEAVSQGVRRIRAVID